MKVNLEKEECQFLSAAMNEAIAQADEEIGKTARTASEAEKAENLQLRNMFVGIRTKMDVAVVAIEDQS